MTEPASDPEPEEVSPPLLRVVNGDPTTEEVAALVSLISALVAGRASGADRPRSEWAAPRRGVRGTHRHGPGAWRAQAR